MAKQKTLPSAKPKSTGDEKGKRTNGAKKTQTSIHLTEGTLKRIEEVKYRLFAEHNLKAKKSAIMELALKKGLSDLEQLAKALQGS